MVCKLNFMLHFIKCEILVRCVKFNNDVSTQQNSLKTDSHLLHNQHSHAKDACLFCQLLKTDKQADCFWGFLVYQYVPIPKKNINF